MMHFLALWLGGCAFLTLVIVLRPLSTWAKGLAAGAALMLLAVAVYFA